MGKDVSGLGALTATETTGALGGGWRGSGVVLGRCVMRKKPWAVVAALVGCGGPRGWGEAQ